MTTSDKTKKLSFSEKKSPDNSSTEKRAYKLLLKNSTIHKLHERLCFSSI